MSIFRAVKIISSVPNEVTPNTIYFVRVGSGFDLYCSDTTGAIAFKVNDLSPGNILSKLLEVDGEGSGLNADLIDNFEATQLSKSTSNIETITNQRDLLNTDSKYQYLTCSTPQVVNLPNPLNNLHKEFTIVNKGNSIIEIKENNVSINLFLDPTGVVECQCDGTNWNIFIKY